MAKSTKTLAEEALAMSEKAGRLKKRARDEGDAHLEAMFRTVERGLEDAAEAMARANSPENG